MWCVRDLAWPRTPASWLVVSLIACGSSPPPPAAPPTTTSDPAPPAAESAQGPNGLAISTIDPPTGDVDGGTYAVVKGTRFLADGARAAKIYFGARPGTIVRFQSDGELIVQAPGGALNEIVDVTVVFEPGGALKLPRAFTFVTRVP